MLIAYTLRTIVAGVIALVGLGHSGYAQCLPAPSNFTVVGGANQCGGPVTLQWSQVPGAASYEIARGTTTSSGTAVTLASVFGQTATSFEDTTAPTGEFVYYFIRCKSASNPGCPSGLGPWSPGVVTRVTNPMTVAPSTPWSQSSGCHFITVQWLAAPNAQSYELWSSTTQNLADASVYSTTSSTSFETTSASLGGQYIWVRGKNSCGAGPFSARGMALTTGNGRVTGANVGTPSCTQVSANVTNASFVEVVFIWSNAPGGPRFLGPVPTNSSGVVVSPPLIGAVPGQVINMEVAVRLIPCGGVVDDLSVTGTIPGASTASVPTTVAVAGQPATIEGIVTPTARTGVSFSWTKDNAPLQSDNGRITGLSTPTLTFASTKIEDVGVYTLYATTTCGSGEVRSSGVLAVRVPCRSDFDQSGSLSTLDVFDFLNSWFDGCP